MFHYFSRILWLAAVIAICFAGYDQYVLLDLHYQWALTKRQALELRHENIDLGIPRITQRWKDTWVHNATIKAFDQATTAMLCTVWPWNKLYATDVKLCESYHRIPSTDYVGVSEMIANSSVEIASTIVDFLHRVPYLSEIEQHDINRFEEQRLQYSANADWLHRDDMIIALDRHLETLRDIEEMVRSTYQETWLYLNGYSYSIDLLMKGCRKDGGFRPTTWETSILPPFSTASVRWFEYAEKLFSYCSNWKYSIENTLYDAEEGFLSSRSALIDILDTIDTKNATAQVEPDAYTFAYLRWVWTQPSASERTTQQAWANHAIRALLEDPATFEKYRTALSDSNKRLYFVCRAIPNSLHPIVRGDSVGVRKISCPKISAVWARANDTLISLRYEAEGAYEAHRTRKYSAEWRLREIEGASL